MEPTNASTKRAFEEEEYSEDDEHSIVDKTPKHKTKKKLKTNHLGVFEPSSITVGYVRASPDISIYAKMVLRTGGAPPYVKFQARSFGTPTYEGIWFDAEYWRGSLAATKAYVATLFTFEPWGSGN